MTFQEAIELSLKTNELTHYKLNSEEPANHNFESLSFLRFWLQTKYNNEEHERGLNKISIIYLLSIEEDGDTSYGNIFIEDDLGIISDLLEDYEMSTKFHLHEYNSFEDAYEVALLMREGHYLCKSL